MTLPGIPKNRGKPPKLEPETDQRQVATAEKQREHPSSDQFASN